MSGSVLRLAFLAVLRSLAHYRPVSPPASERPAEGRSVPCSSKVKWQRITVPYCSKENASPLMSKKMQKARDGDGTGLVYCGLTRLDRHSGPIKSANGQNRSWTPHIQNSDGVELAVGGWEMGDVGCTVLPTLP
jgi:hypothetical protein